MLSTSLSSVWAWRTGALVAATGMLLPAVERETHQINGQSGDGFEYSRNQSAHA